MAPVFKVEDDFLDCREQVFSDLWETLLEAIVELDLELLVITLLDDCHGGLTDLFWIACDEVIEHQ